MNPKNFTAFMSNGKELTLAGVRDVVDLEPHKVMDGRPIGVVFEHEGKQYRITKKCSI